MHDADADAVHNRHGTIAERDNRQPVSNAYPLCHGYPDSHDDGDADADSYRYGDPDTDVDAYCDGYADCHADADADSHRHGDPDTDADADADTDTDTDADSHGHCYRYSYSNPNSHPDPLTHLASALWQPRELGPGSLGWRAGVLVEVPGCSETEQPQPVPRERLLREAGACCPVEGHWRECLSGG